MSRGTPVADRGRRSLRGASLIAAVVDDARRDRDRFCGEDALLAAPGSDAAKRGEALARAWRSLKPGFAALLDLMDGR